MMDAPAPATSGLTPYLALDGAARAADFYVRAFGATEVFRLSPDEQGRLLHCHLHTTATGRAVVALLSDFFPEHGGQAEAPQGYTLHLAVDDADAWFVRAIGAGATVRMPLEDAFWGDRYGQLRDPFGVTWSIGSPLARDG